MNCKLCAFCFSTPLSFFFFFFLQILRNFTSVLIVLSFFPLPSPTIPSFRFPQIAQFYSFGFPFCDFSDGQIDRNVENVNSCSKATNSINPRRVLVSFWLFSFR